MSIKDFKYVIKIEFEDGCSFYTGQYSYCDEPKDGARYKTEDGQAITEDITSLRNCFVDEVKIYPALLESETIVFHDHRQRYND